MGSNSFQRYTRLPFLFRLAFSMLRPPLAHYEDLFDRSLAIFLVKFNMWELEYNGFQIDNNGELEQYPLNQFARTSSSHCYPQGYNSTYEPAKNPYLRIGHMT